jgi:hypothetical protein
MELNTWGVTVAAGVDGDEHEGGEDKDGGCCLHVSPLGGRGQVGDFSSFVFFYFGLV